MEASLRRFRAANTQVLGISIDSIYSHANWASDLGGVSFPLLSDFEPKGAVAKSLGVYLDGPGITDRATVIVDRTGTVRFRVSVTPSGARDISELAAECERVNDEQDGAGELPRTQPLPSGTLLFVKSRCGHSRKSLLAVDNLHLRDKILVRNVTDDAAALAEMQEIGGKNQAPCLVMDGAAMYEADEIVAALIARIAPI